MDVLQKEPTQMTLEDWEVFMDAFKSWPLHPTVSYPCALVLVLLRCNDHNLGEHIARVCQDDG